ncbi:nicotinamide riboside transporter PnuC [Paludibacteraceae bacterium OttesenSCG-928-F17]|nr:nicotinamide riboside transporter PnuC [Paludibacteraceae bacterium OttesenSCG-928-F17]
MINYIQEHWVELLGSILSFIYLYLSVKQKSSLWIFGFLCSVLYIVVFFQSKFYADMTLQVYYMAVSIYGWINWKFGKTKAGNEIPITRTPKKVIPYLILATIAIFFAYYFVLINTDSPLPKADSLTTALSIVATWMLAKKYIEYWIVFIFVDGLSAGLYFYKDLYPTAILFVIYTVMAIVGYYQWRKTTLSYSENNQVLSEQ